MELIQGSFWSDIAHNLTIYDLRTLSTVGRYFRRELWDNENYWLNRALTERIIDYAAPTSWKHFYASPDLLCLSDWNLHFTNVPFPEQISDVKGDQNKSLFILSVSGNVYIYDSLLTKLTVPETIQAIAVWNNAALFLGRHGQIYGCYNKQVTLMDSSCSLRFTHLAMENDITAMLTVDNELYVCKKNPRDPKFLQRYLKYAEPEKVSPPTNTTQLLIINNKVHVLTSVQKLLQVFPGKVPELWGNNVIKYDQRSERIYRRNRCILSSNGIIDARFRANNTANVEFRLCENKYTYGLVCYSNVCVTSWRHVAQLIGQRKLKFPYIEGFEVEPYRGTFEIVDNAGTIFRFDAVYTPRQGTFSAIE